MCHFCYATALFRPVKSTSKSTRQNFAFSKKYAGLKKNATVAEVTNISNELVIIVAFTFLVILPGIHPDYIALMRQH